MAATSCINGVCRKYDYEKKEWKPTGKNCIKKHKKGN